MENKSAEVPFKKIMVVCGFSLALVFLAFGVERITGNQSGKFFDVSKAIALVLYFVAYILVGRKIIVSAFAALFNKTIWVEGLIVTVASLICILLGQYIGAILAMMIFYIGESLSKEI